MAGYCTLVLYFHSHAARENTAAHSCNIQPYYLLTHQIIYMYMLKKNTSAATYLLLSARKGESDTEYEKKKKKKREKKSTAQC